MNISELVYGNLSNTVDTLPAFTKVTDVSCIDWCTQEASKIIVYDYKSFILGLILILISQVLMKYQIRILKRIDNMSETDSNKKLMKSFYRFLITTSSIAGWGITLYKLFW